MALLKKILTGILAWESKLILRKYKPFIVAVTGSVGKTSAKDAIYCVLKGQFRYARKSQKSFNSDFGLPLTVIGVPNAWRSVGGWLGNMLAGLRLIVRRAEYPDCLVLEMGADHPNDIRSVARWLRPDIVVITRVSSTPVHVEFFASPEDVFEEKASLATGVEDGGTVVLFADDAKVMSIADRVKGRDVKVVSFGFADTADVRGSAVRTTYDPADNAPQGISFDMTIKGATVEVAQKGIIGQTYEYPLLAAAAVGVAKGIASEAIAASLATYEPPRGRMNLIPGVNGSTIIDDTYNSSPDAAEAALGTLRGLQCSGRRIAALGDMMELGKYAADEHRRIGRLAGDAATLLVTVGPRSRMTADEALKHGMPSTSVTSFDSSADATAFLAPLVLPGDIILVKGSQSVRMERVSAALLREPARSAELLVRQEREWLLKK